MSAALAYLEDDLPLPRPARHLYLVAVDGRIVGKPRKITVTAAGRKMRSRQGIIDCATGDPTRHSQSLEDGGYAYESAAIDGQPMLTVSGRVLFDAMGRSVKQYYPVSEPLGQDGSFNPAFDSVAPTVTEYDVLDRPTQTTLPDQTSTRIVYGFGDDANGVKQFKTTVTDANGKEKESYRDVRELITSVKETNNKQDISTRYAYDPLKQITQVVDAKGHTTSVAYDHLGRRTRIANPDTGTTETVYDLAGNPVQKITAVLKLQGKAVTYDYDYRRLAAIHYPNNPGNDVSYTYGADTAEAKQHNQVGRLVKVTSEAGSDERQYGKLGELTRQTKTVSSSTQGHSTNSPEVYTTGFAYDTFGRILTLTLPDGEIVTHRYDAGGNLEHIEGERQGDVTQYLQTLHYDKFEQRTTLKHGNGVETRYTYDAANRRLNNLASEGAVAGRFQNLNYGYDKVGNIMTLANDVAVPPANSFGGPTTQSYGYDDLYRLTSATGTFKSSPSKVRDYTLAMRYDSIHNIVAKTQRDTISSSGSNPIEQKGTSYDWAYAYGGSQPHAPTHIGNRTFYYDANGNQTGWTDDKNGNRRDIVWDEDNRIQSIADNGSTSRYKYDEAGQRVFKTGKQGETVYVNQYYVVRNRSIVSKHVFAGTSRVATKLETGNGNTGNVRSSGTGASQGGTGQSKGSTSDSGSAKGSGNAYAYGQDKDHGQSGQEHGNNTNSAAADHQQGKGNNSLARNGAEASTNLPGNSEAGLENALANGQGNKYGIYKRLDKLGLEVDVGGEIVPEGTGGTEPTPSTGAVQPSLFLYYYHPDHLGSTGYVTAADGKLYEHLEYFPFGETWVEEHSNIQRTPYLFTGKELDEETKLYYFGARYYDPRTSVWQSADPILGNYLPAKGQGNQGLPGLGGIYNPVNVSMYAYAGLNPMKYVDPDGKFLVSSHQPVIGGRTHNFEFQRPNVPKAAAGFLPFISVVVAGYDMQQVFQSSNAAGDVRLDTAKGFVATTAANAVSPLKAASTTGKVGKFGVTGTDNVLSGKSLYDNIRGAHFGESNNAASAEGWKNMQEGRGFDDPDFMLSMLSQYDEKFGTDHHGSVTKRNGSIGFLQFRGEEGKKVMNEMIEQARQDVIKKRSGGTE